MKQWTLCRNLYYFFHHYLQGRQGGVVVYQYIRKTFAKMPKNTQNSFKYMQNYTQAYFKPEIQRKW